MNMTKHCLDIFIGYIRIGVKNLLSDIHFDERLYKVFLK